MKGISKRNIANFSIKSFDVTIVIMTVCLVCGVVIGCATSFHMNEPFSLFKEYNVFSEGVSVNYSYLKVYFNLIKYPLIVFLLGFTAFGEIAVPLTVAVKGFFISFSVSLMMHGNGTHGLLCALAVFGVQAIISVPSILILSSVSFRFSKLFSSRMVMRPQVKQQTINASTYIIVFSAFFITALLLAFIDTVATPWLVSLTAL